MRRASPVEANMSIKSTPTRYGAVAIAIHWLTALLIAGQLVGGFVAAQASDAQIKASILRAHVPIGLIVLGLTLFRIGWWAFADRKPRAVEDLSPLEALATKAAHVLMYVAMVALALSGVALVATSGAGRALFGGDGSLPDFPTFPPFYAHVAAAFFLLLLLAVHLGAALYHQFIRGDRLLARMGIGGTFVNRR
jgi:cytochrome b561